MSKEKLQNLKEMPEEELRELLKEAQQEKNYLLELEICEALYQYEENPCLASTYMKELRAYLEKIGQSRSN
jgi:hypothetical protein